MPPIGQWTGLQKTPGDSLVRGDDEGVFVIHSTLLHLRNILIWLFAFFRSNKKQFWISVCYQTRQISSLFIEGRSADIFQLKKNQSIFLCRVPTCLTISCVFFFLNFKCHPTMEKDFCQSLIEKDKETMKVVVDKYLSTLTLHEDQQQNFEKIKIWIENYDCVESVEIGYGVLDTEPPIKVFIIKLKNSLMQPTIGILLQKNKWIFNYK